MRTIATLLLLPLLAAPALAQGTSIEMTDAVPGSSGVTYLDLAKVVAPDIQQVEGKYQGTVAQPVRSIPYADDEPVQDAPVSFYSLSAASFISDGTDMVALMLESDNPDAIGSAVVAIFDPAHPEKLVDLADVATDQFTGFGSPQTLDLGSQDEGLLVHSYHFNSSEGYTMTTLIALVDGKLTEMASVFTLNENYCGMRRQQNQSFAPVLSDVGERWQPFSITISESTTLNGCEGEESVKAGTRAVSATFSWSTATGSYEPDSTALDDFYKETEARF